MRTSFEECQDLWHYDRAPIAGFNERCPSCRSRYGKLEFYAPPEVKAKLEENRKRFLARIGEAVKRMEARDAEIRAKRARGEKTTRREDLLCPPPREGPEIFW